MTGSRSRGAGRAFLSDVIPWGISVANPQPALGTPLVDAFVAYSGSLAREFVDWLDSRL